MPRFFAGCAVGVVMTGALAWAVPASARDEHHAFDRTVPMRPAPSPATGSIFQAGQGYAGLYEGNRANSVGDPVTIRLVERTSASKSAGTNLDSSGGFSLIPPSAGPLSIAPGNLELGGDRGFDGAGKSGQSNALSGSITVTVAAVYPNDTMLVQGRKRVTINRGDEYIEIRGIVRSADIDQNNQVPSTRVADARIAYTGKGDVHRASRQGWLSRFFSVISPF